MSWLQDVRFRLRALTGRHRLEQDLDAELRFHVDEAIAKYRRTGLSFLEARRRALSDLGGLDQIKEDCRDARGVSAIDTLRRDARDGLRSIAGQPVLSSIIVGTLALGIAANTTVFSLVDGVLLRELPVADPQQLATVEGPAGTGTQWSYAIWQEIHRRQGLFAGSLAWITTSFDISSTAEADPVNGAYVSGSYFEVLGIRPSAGRLLTEADDVRGGPAACPAIVISAHLWQQRFRDTADVVGRSLTIKGQRLPIAGVAPASFSGLDVGGRPDVYLPIGCESIFRPGASLLDQRSSAWLSIMVRLRPDQSLRSASASLAGLEPQIRAATVPDSFISERDKQAFAHDVTFSLRGSATGNSRLRGQYGTPLQLLLAAAGVVLAAACAGLSNLLLARADDRRHEMGVRLALGADRADLIRQMLVEALGLALTGAALAWPLGHWAADRLVVEISAPGSPVFVNLETDWRVIAFTSALTIATTLVFGIAPAIRATRVDAAASIKRGSRTFASGGRPGTAGGLVVAQVSLSLVLVVAASLFGRTFVALTTMPLGFEPDRLFNAEIALPTKPSPPLAALPQVYDAVIDAAQHVPGVDRAAAARIVPIVGGLWRQDFGVTGSPRTDPAVRSYVNAVSRDWFATMDIRLAGGRTFGDRDAAGAPLVAIVNQAFVQAAFAGAPALGRTIVQEPSLPAVRRLEVVGVVADTIYRTQREAPQPTVYLPLGQLNLALATITLTFRTSPGSPATVARDVTASVLAADSRLRVLSTSAYPAAIGATIQRERLLASLSGFFGGIALLLAAVGLYGVTRHSVVRRERELGIRLMLGALPRSLMWTAVRRVAALIAFGLGLGLVGCWWASRFVASALFGVGPHDAVTVGGAVGLLALVAGAAAWLPARRAAGSESSLTAPRLTLIEPVELRDSRDVARRAYFSSSASLAWTASPQIS